MADGCLVGLDVGLGEGAFVMGEAVGFSVGGSVGEAVGASVSGAVGETVVGK